MSVQLQLRQVRVFSIEVIYQQEISWLPTQVKIYSLHW